MLVGNVDEVVRFWVLHGIKSRLDWAGMSRRRLRWVAGDSRRCDAAGEGAGVEYDVEVQDRANGRGVEGADIRIITLHRPKGEAVQQTPLYQRRQGNDARTPEGGSQPRRSDRPTRG